MAKLYFDYCNYSETIRLWPANYLVAFKDRNRFIADVDAAIPDKLAAKIFIALRSTAYRDNSFVLKKLNSLL